MAEAAALDMRPAGDAKPRLSVRGLHAFYGESHVLHGMEFDVSNGEVITLLGRNGAGKTTTLRAIIGQQRNRRGSILFDGIETIGLPARQIARMGVGYVPEERGIFSSLSVLENLHLPPALGAAAVSDDEIFELFPNLRERLDSQGTKLSGGEQQMLAIARILRAGFRFLLLDEPTEGLAPVIIEQISRTIRILKERGYTIVLVEQNFHFASSVADRHYIVEQGRVVDMVRADALEQNRAKLHKYLGI
ncbi:ABC transporter ATP-binding protein [Arvimicrobium flavum]|uniref:ABC transporter ATP-binding protein n=1 Tax=Arvimicrobium flavum TaxID=3393320 RepID=UPI00237A6051|nr:ABC transporter ATP-binding protein [Mesorhizobium shangrilense]